MVAPARRRRFGGRDDGEGVELGAPSRCARLLHSRQANGSTARIPRLLAHGQRLAVVGEHRCVARRACATNVRRSTFFACGIDRGSKRPWVARRVHARPRLHWRARRSGNRPGVHAVAALLFAGVVVAGVALHVALRRYRKWLLLTLRWVFRRRWLRLRRAARRFADALLVFERAHVRFAPRASSWHCSGRVLRARICGRGRERRRAIAARGVGRSRTAVRVVWSVADLHLGARRRAGRARLLACAVCGRGSASVCRVGPLRAAQRRVHRGLAARSPGCSARTRFWNAPSPKESGPRR